MKTTKIKNHGSFIIPAILALVICLCGPATAQISLNAWTGSSTYTGNNGGSGTWGTTNYAVGSINATTGNQAICTYLNAKSDLAGSVVTIWGDANAGGTNATAIGLFANSTTQVTMRIVWDSTGTNWVGGYLVTNGLTLGDPVIIRHLANDNYEVRVVTAITATNITVNTAPTTAVANGDLMYPMVPVGTITLGANTLALGPGNLIATGSPNCPFMLSVNYTSAGNIQAMSGMYR